jgi:hypothetical protein
MRLACDRLLADYRWGAGHAWRRLVRFWREFAPETARIDLDPHKAHSLLERRVEEHTAWVCEQVVRRAGAAASNSQCLFLSRLFGSRAIGDVVRSTAEAAGIAAQCLEARWLEWMCATGDE